MNTNTITGRVTDSTGNGVPGVIALAWDVDGLRGALDNYESDVIERGYVAAYLKLMRERAVDESSAPTSLGSAATDEGGSFRIDYDDETFRQSDEGQQNPPDLRPDIALLILAQASRLLRK